MHNSQDFQWSPTVILVAGEDPYRFQENPQSDRFLLTQHPMYLHFTYLMLSPFALLNFEKAKIAWAIANLTFVFGIFLSLRGRFRDVTLVVVMLIFLCFILNTKFNSAMDNSRATACFCTCLLFAFPLNRLTSCRISSGDWRI